MKIRNHKGWGHGLKPGTTADMSCQACTNEDSAGTADFQSEYAKHVAHFTNILFDQPEDELRFGPGLVTDLCECGLDRGEHWDGVGGTGQGCGKFVAR